MFISFLLFILIFFFLSISVSLLFDSIHSSKGYVGGVTDHFNGVEFYSPGKPVSNLFPTHGRNKLFWRWVFSRKKNIWTFNKNKFRTVPEKRVQSDKIFVTFINHSTVLIQTKGLNILTDPVWSHRASPFFFLGPKRYSEPGINLKELPPIDIILLSHNHYDHMDIKTLRFLSVRDNPRIFTSLGNAFYLKSRRVKGAKDMEWWDRENIASGIDLVAVPAQHFSGRSFSDRNKTLWCGFVLETPRGNIYFAGDTGYGGFVEKIKEKYSSFLISLIPIGAYKPEWFMGEVHLSPSEAVNVHKEIKSQTSIGIHFGTFKLADDGQEEAREVIKNIVLRDTQKIDFRVLENGQTVVV